MKEVAKRVQDDSGRLLGFITNGRIIALAENYRQVCYALQFTSPQVPLFDIYDED
ncbi:hypothetical protein [Alicyclobacillus acidoterrestris]|uniref:Uncharacterized protein n=1 Tax=Alicyclobacillus acidoterrestris (strain ATCC 49025 / DSM 3922 / CIP 106132 / NCIMB 13137 / GD3B) TaxID=1356854 RepID=T0BSM8_ALIAG|nr:hypothetical protein [Alicyclobacillus acidoterrestris]EPZ43809.1 hypothetical protein N007_12205 [Alicyclobacillus acidoterrestris ATCC 49025]UNO51000.1 hypothetical protein K1I37_21260 [Alicyclobacillus acidoterrestris]GEO27932.1 hypothetical protein AAC03nite_37170 [Alicyclobacillus acidoterrestris]